MLYHLRLLILTTGMAAASLTKAERKTLISLLKKIGYKAVGYSQSEEDAA
jgi:hypothetical protein